MLSQVNKVAPENIIDKKITTLVEQNSHIQNEMQEIHKIIIDKNLKESKEISKSYDLCKMNFYFTIPAINKQKLTSYDDSYDNFLGDNEANDKEYIFLNN